MPGKYNIVRDGGRILCTIENASLEDDGEWTLIAETPKCTLESKCRIIVKEPPPKTEESDLKKQFDFEIPAITRVRHRVDSESSAASSPVTKRAKHLMLEEEKEREEPPKFHHLLEDVSTREGESVILSVTSSTIPEPSVFWYRNGLLIERTTTNYIIKSDKGKYRYG
jgi:hypothetical protein